MEFGSPKNIKNATLIVLIFVQRLREGDAERVELRSLIGWKAS